MRVFVSILWSLACNFFGEFVSYSVFDKQNCVSKGLYEMLLIWEGQSKKRLSRLMLHEFLLLFR